MTVGESYTDDGGAPLDGKFEPVPGEARWLLAKRCPGCGSVNDKQTLGTLRIEEYRHGDEIIAIPEQEIELIRCCSCGLVFKSVLPSPHLLAEAFVRQAGRVWTDTYDYADEAKVIHALTGNGPFDVLDIGASGGGLLRALWNTEGRRSALDIVAHPGIAEWIRGEFVRGLVDGSDLTWSNKPYDVVTMFDVAEHLYDPEQAFVNLRRLVKPGGFVVAETGDAESFWPSRYGIDVWWYAYPVEHHVFWTEQSFENVAARHGFRVLSFERKRHKEQSITVTRGSLARAAKDILYRSSPIVYAKLAEALGKPGRQPWSPFARDHFRVVLQKEA